MLGKRQDEDQLYQVGQINEEDDPMITKGYQREYGGYKPHFKSVTPGYFPIEYIDIFYIIVFTIFLYAIQVPIWYGLWKAGEANSDEFGMICFIIFIGFYLLVVIGIYFGGRQRRVTEAQMIKQKLIEIEKSNQEKLKRQEELQKLNIKQA